MNAAQFHDSLRQSGGYHTEGGRGAVSGLLWRWDAWYYMHLFGIVLAAANRCRKGRYDAAAWARSSFETLRSVERAGGYVEITGFNNLIGVKGPAVIVGNHMSMLETMLLPVVLLAANYTAFVVKEDLMTYPLFGRVLQTVGAISVTRRNPREDLVSMLAQGEARLRAGQSVMIFPQSTRSQIVQPENFNSAGIKLARRAEVPVVPLALKTDFQGLGKRLKDFGPLDRQKPVRLRFGPPILSLAHPKAAHEESLRFIMETTREWDGETGGASLARLPQLEGGA
jgi:1-acyl-sn-glycerol-3-phosphate acyltransferase